MNFFKYIGIDKETFIEKYLHGGWVNEGVHKTLPLNIFCYSRKCQYESNWDSVISKCRGIVIDRNTHNHRCCPGRRSCGKCLRGTICGPCNRGLGFFQDDVVRLQKAIDYLNKF